VSNRYVIAAGSVAYPNNDRSQPLEQYRAIDKTAPTAAPAAFIKFLIEKAGKKPIEKHHQPEPGGKVLEGGRNNYLTMQAGKFRQSGQTAEEYLPALLRINQEVCTPPLEDEEVEVIAHSIGKKPVKDETVLSGGKPAGTEPHVQAAQSAEPQPWGVPTPFEGGLSPVLPFEHRFLPVGIKDWIVDTAERMSVPLDFAAVCALVTLAGVTGRRAFVYPKAFDKEWKESICLPGAVIAASGKTKTPAWKTFTNIVVEQEMDWRKDYQRKKAQYDDDLRNWEKAQDQNKKSTIKVESARPEEPVCRRALLNDATPEALHRTMSDNPEGVLYYRDELSGWVAELDKKGYEAQRDLFLAAMNGNDARGQDRIGRGTVFATMCASVFGSFQPELLKDFLNESRNVSDGTIPRFLFLVWPDDQQKPLVDRAANERAKEQFRQIVRKLANLRAESITLHFAPEAQTFFNAWLARHVQKLERETNPGKQSHLAKYKGAFPKIGALLQLIDLAAAPGMLSGTHLVDIEHAKMAADILVYLELHMHRVYDCIKSPLQIAEEALAKHIAAGDLKDLFTLRDIERKHWSGLDDGRINKDALDTLEEKHWVRYGEVVGPKGGRPTVKWTINPVLLKS
jgi:hypothetical protein